MLGFKGRTDPPNKASTPQGYPKPTSRSQTSLSIRPIKKNCAVIPRVAYQFF